MKLERYKSLMFAYYLIFGEDAPIYRFCNPACDGYVKLLETCLKEKRKIIDNDLFKIFGNNFDCINSNNTEIKEDK